MGDVHVDPDWPQTVPDEIRLLRNWAETSPLMLLLLDQFSEVITFR